MQDSGERGGGGWGRGLRCAKSCPRNIGTVPKPVRDRPKITCAGGGRGGVWKNSDFGHVGGGQIFRFLLGLKICFSRAEILEFEGVLVIIRGESVYFFLGQRLFFLGLNFAVFSWVKFCLLGQFSRFFLGKILHFSGRKLKIFSGKRLKNHSLQKLS